MYSAFSFASFAKSDTRAGGWGIGEKHGDLPADVVDGFVAYVPTSINDAVNLSAYPAQKELAQRTRRYAFFADSNGNGGMGSIFFSSVSAGDDATGRPGNVYTYVGVFAEDAAADAPVDPTALMYSPDIPTPYKSVATNRAAIPQSADIAPGILADGTVLNDFLDGSEELPVEFTRVSTPTVDRRSQLAALASYAAQAQRDGSILVVGGQLEEFNLWAAALYRELDQPLSFTTFERANTLQRMVAGGITVAFVEHAELADIRSLGLNATIVDLREALEPLEEETAEEAAAPAAAAPTASAAAEATSAAEVASEPASFAEFGGFDAPSGETRQDAAERLAELSSLSDSGLSAGASLSDIFGGSTDGQSEDASPRAEFEPAESAERANPFAKKPAGAAFVVPESERASQSTAPEPEPQTAPDEGYDVSGRFLLTEEDKRLLDSDDVRLWAGKLRNLQGSEDNVLNRDRIMYYLALPYDTYFGKRAMVQCFKAMLTTEVQAIPAWTVDVMSRTERMDLFNSVVEELREDQAARHRHWEENYLPGTIRDELFLIADAIWPHTERPAAQNYPQEKKSSRRGLFGRKK